MKSKEELDREADEICERLMNEEDVTKTECFLNTIGLWTSAEEMKEKGGTFLPMNLNGEVKMDDAIETEGRPVLEIARDLVKRELQDIGKYECREHREWIQEHLGERWG